MKNIRTILRPAAALLLSLAAAGAMAGSQSVAVSIVGPGGHSNGDYGNVNAVHAAARSIMLIEKAVPDAVVSDIQGGNSVNSIAASADFIVTITGDEASLKAQADKVKAAVEAHAACQTTLEQARKTLAAMQAKSSYEATLLRMKTLTEEMALARHVETLLQQKATIEASTARMAASADPIWWEASGAPEMQGLLHRLEERLDAIEKRHPGLCTVLSTPDNTHLKSLSEERNALDKWTSDLAEGERACRAAELKEREALENKSLSAERFRKAQALLEKLEGELRHTRENRDAASKALEAEKTHAQELRSQLPDLSLIHI